MVYRNANRKSQKLFGEKSIKCIISSSVIAQTGCDICQEVRGDNWKYMNNRVGILVCNTSSQFMVNVLKFQTLLLKFCFLVS